MSYQPTSEIWGGRIAWAGHIVLWLSGIGVLAMRWRRKKMDK
ncbi:MAG: hypothetical protein U5J63_07190 [Fodinibius sp.]|nr:hypothetical protein [Fodinibius sp.]